VFVETSPSRVESEDPRLFESAVGEQPERRLSKAEALVYVRSIRARLRRSAVEAVGRDHRHEHRRVA
jgi:hypothetical protein